MSVKTRALVLMAVVSALMLRVSVPFYAAEWIKEDERWWYRLDNGMPAQEGWVEVNSKWYLLAALGAMKTGWLKWRGRWFYFGENGAMLTGGHKVGGEQRLFGDYGVWQVEA